MRNRNIIEAEFATATDDRKREIELEVQLDIRLKLKQLEGHTELISQAMQKTAKIA